MGFEPIKKLKVAEQVVGAIREAIVAGKYQEGDSLPSERELATQFGVNRSSIREAMLRLEAWGLVNIRQGGATRVRDLFYGAGLQVLPFLIAPNGKLDEDIVDDILPVRTMFLSWTAEIAANAARPEHVQRLDEMVDELEAAKSTAEIQRLDFAFFEGLVLAGDNRVLGLFTRVLGDIVNKNEAHLRFLYPSTRFDLRHHRATVEAISAGDAKAAGAAMRAYGDSAHERRQR